MQVSVAPVERVVDELSSLLALVMKTSQGGVVRVAGELELTLSQLRALFVLLYAERPPALTELAPAVGLSLPATGRLVDALVRAGLVDRREDEHDRRVKRLSLTAAGSDAMDRLTAARREGLRAFAEQLGDDERDRLSAALAPILDRFGAACAGPTETPHRP